MFGLFWSMRALSSALDPKKCAPAAAPGSLSTACPRPACLWGLRWHVSAPGHSQPSGACCCIHARVPPHHTFLHCPAKQRTGEPQSTPPKHLPLFHTPAPVAPSLPSQPRQAADGCAAAHRRRLLFQLLPHLCLQAALFGVALGAQGGRQSGAPCGRAAASFLLDMA